MHFDHPYLLFVLFLGPVLAVLLILAYRKKVSALKTLGDLNLLDKISTQSRTKQKIKLAFILSAVLFLIITASGPQFGTKLVEMKEKGADVVILIDVSNSMLAEDNTAAGIAGQTRLTKAKNLLSQLISGLGGNRIGIIAFAGTAFWQCPLTLDITSANMFLEILDANIIPLGGTQIGTAVRLAVKGLEKSPPGSKSIILLTDGEDHKSDPEGAAEEAAKNGVKIYAIGFGNPNGEPIPLKDESGNLKEYKKNKKGEVVMSKLDEKLLTKMCSETGGGYFKSSEASVDTALLLNKIKGLDKNNLTAHTNREYEDRFQYPLFIVLILLLLEMFLPETKKQKANA